jgi:hypothetical protein
LLLAACCLLLAACCLQFCVTINWPTSWLATRGYTSFTLGFETYQEAAQWHALVQRQLSALRVRAASSKGDAASSAGHSSKPSYDDSLGLRGAGSVNGAGVGRKQSQVRATDAGVVVQAGAHARQAPVHHARGVATCDAHRPHATPQGFVAAALEHFWSSGPPRDDKQSGEWRACTLRRLGCRAPCPRLPCCASLCSLLRVRG